MKKEREIPESMFAVNKSGRWLFSTEGLEPHQFDEMFPSRYDSVRCELAQSRVLQKLCQAYDYNLEVRFFQAMTGSHPRGTARSSKEDLIIFGPHDRAASLQERFEVYKKGAGLHAPFGWFTMPVLPIREFASSKLASDEERLSISESSERIWAGASRDMRAVIHNWLTKGGIFMPEIYHKKPSPRKGCQMSLSDQVVIGLLYSLFSFGFSYSVIQNTVKLAPFVSTTQIDQMNVA